MNGFVVEAKKKLKEANVNPNAIEIAINIYRNPDEVQKVSEEIFRLREENEKLAFERDDIKKLTNEFVEEVKVFLKSIEVLDINSVNFRESFFEIQRRAAEANKVFEMMEILHS